MHLVLPHFQLLLVLLGYRLHWQTSLVPVGFWENTNPAELRGERSSEQNRNVPEHEEPTQTLISANEASVIKHGGSCQELTSGATGLGSTRERASEADPGGPDEDKCGTSQML